MINRVKTPEDAALALTILDQGRKARALLEQHVPFTHHTSNLFVMVRIYWHTWRNLCLHATYSIP